MVPPIRSDRPAFGRRAALLAGGAGLLALSGLPRAATAHAGRFDYTSREAFDTFDRVFHDGERAGQPDDTNEAGALAWGQSYVLAAFVRMYLAHGDPHYLDRLVHNVDLMLTTRDSERGVRDYRGRSLPAWRAMNPYTVGVTALPGADGRPALEVRSARTYADTTTATVRHGDGGTFDLTVRNDRFGFVDTYPGLSTDPASEHYAPRRVYQAYRDSRTMTTARALGDGGRPAEGAYPLVSQPVVFAVHTGMITFPVASFVRLVRSDPRLRTVARYQEAAEEYLPAVRAAVEVHDREWRQNDAGEGWYAWVKGMPLPFDGIDQPVNQSTALGRTLLELAAITGEQSYVDRAARIARMFRHQLIQRRGTWVWHYWPRFSAIWDGYEQTGSPDTDLSSFTPRYGSSGNGADQLEDCSHGAISVDFARLAFDHGVVFTNADLLRFARTFTNNLATTDADGVATVYTRVDGTGTASSGQYLQAPRWMGAAWWDADVFDHCRAIYDQRAPEPGSGSGLLAVANLNWGARAGTRGASRA